MTFCSAEKWVSVGSVSWRGAGSTPQWRHFGTLEWLFWAEPTESVWRAGGVWAGDRLGHEYISAGWCWEHHQAGSINKESRPEVQLRSGRWVGSQTSLHGPLAGGNSSQVYLALPVWEEENRNPDFHMKSLLLKIWTPHSFFKWWKKICKVKFSILSAQFSSIKHIHII